MAGLFLHLPCLHLLFKQKQRHTIPKYLLISFPIVAIHSIVSNALSNVVHSYIWHHSQGHKAGKLFGLHPV